MLFNSFLMGLRGQAAMQAEIIAFPEVGGLHHRYERVA
jgi:hypothetical protein